jgi:hypothetical protein
VGDRPQTGGCGECEDAVSARSRLARSLRRFRAAPPARVPWVVAQEQPPSPEPLDDVRLFGIIGAWMEEDVIGATVANAFAQGCERIYLVDNDSPDTTVRVAVDAGAILAESFATEQYDELLRLEIMNRVVRDVSMAEGDEHLWWLWLDADEFPHGPRGTTIAEFLAPLDRRFRIVGARFINHFPDRTPGYISGFHPIDFQPLCEEHRMGCARRHRKHPLQRFDRHGLPIICDRGFHRATSDERPLLEPTDAVFLHHFPYREETFTRRRLETLCANDAAGRTRVQEGDDAADGMVPRFQTLDAVYRQDWDQVRNYRIDGEFSVARPIAWTDLATPADLEIKRWYTTADLDDARTESAT